MAYKRKRTCQRRKVAKTGRCLSWTGTGGTHNKQVFRLYRPAENKMGGDCFET